jgi:hypothetical protein
MIDSWCTSNPFAERGDWSHCPVHIGKLIQVLPLGPF